jgi:hypothetical protein
MSAPSHIVGPNGTAVKISKLGQLITAPIAYDEVTVVTLDVNGTGYNLFPAKAGKQFVITGILLTADSNVTGSANIDIYEADAVDEATIVKSILNIELLKNGYRDITGLNILATEGAYINGKTDDDDVFVTMMGYYINKI